MTSQEAFKTPCKPGYWYVNIAKIDEPQNWVQQVQPLQEDNKLFGYEQKEFLNKQYKKGIKMTNKERFQIILKGQYDDLFKLPEYALAASKHTPESMAEKFTNGLITGEANKDGTGIKNTCKALGIKHTYKAIKEYLTKV